MVCAELQRLCGALTGDASALEIDGDRQIQLVRFAQRHRVDTYLHANAPGARWHPAAARLLQHAYQRNTQRLLLAQAWNQRIAGTLAEAGIETRSLKGVPLAALAYERPGDRHCGDIDLLVEDVAQRTTVDARLKALGLKRKDLSALRRRRVHEFLVKTDNFLSDDGQRVEIHFLNHREARAIFPAALQFSSSAWQPFSLGTLHTHRLHGAPLILYLLSHGLRQGWLRLKWLLDLHRLTREYEPGDWAALRAAAMHEGRARDYHTGIGLLHLTLGHAPAASGDAGSKLMRSVCLRWLNDPREPTQWTELKLLRPPYQMLSLPGFWPRFSYLSSLVLR